MTDGLWGLLVCVPIIGVIGLVVAGGLYLYILRQPAGTPLMQEIASAIHEGAMVFLSLYLWCSHYWGYSLAGLPP